MEYTGTLSDLVIFRELRVHQLKVEKARVSATYTLVTRQGESAENRFVYSYSQPVFDTSDPADINLASVMVAQVAMNYGLFCEQLVFNGLYDKEDEYFIRAMTENTSREIYVNKFLSPNEFLVAPFDRISPENPTAYTAAKIRFINSEYPAVEIKKKSQELDNQRFAILSSGGKDSLLTYGIIGEKYEAIPVFVNESGRHWYSAYNAYHYFLANEPRTGKPWCNSDRIFNWVLRYMPFIRKDFQNIRSDIYPVRLWTVAIFVFAVLPIARKYRAKSILVGNEYDTTVRSHDHGISHYAGLYDQSRYFDQAMTRYYQRKYWGFYQYSLLRSLSELLILKILVQRYPSLQTQQVSCHSAHPKEGRMLPCGYCEKCRRIVGMLMALDEDPVRCGYTLPQVKNCLQALESRSVKQLGPDAKQLYFMLIEKALIRSNEHTRRMALQHNEILSLRFDRERSRIADLPRFIRKPLFDLLLEYSNGSLVHDGRKWIPYDLEKDIMHLPYHLEIKK